MLIIKCNICDSIQRKDEKGWLLKLLEEIMVELFIIGFTLIFEIEEEYEWWYESLSLMYHCLIRENVVETFNCDTKCVLSLDLLII
jgi:hypothetical protein